MVGQQGFVLGKAAQAEPLDGMVPSLTVERQLRHHSADDRGADPMREVERRSLDVYELVAGGVA